MYCISTDKYSIWVYILIMYIFLQYILYYDIFLLVINFPRSSFQSCNLGKALLYSQLYPTIQQKCELLGESQFHWRAGTHLVTVALLYFLPPCWLVICALVSLVYSHWIQYMLKYGIYFSPLYLTAEMWKLVKTDVAWSDLPSGAKSGIHHEIVLLFIWGNILETVLCWRTDELWSYCR